MYVVLADTSSIAHSMDCPYSFVVTSLEPLATFSTKRKAERFANKLRDSEDCGYMETHIIYIKASLPMDPTDIPASIVKKFKKQERESQYRHKYGVGHK